jgi:hypothetical protein
VDLAVKTPLADFVAASMERERQRSFGAIGRLTPFGAPTWVFAVVFLNSAK